MKKFQIFIFLVLFGCSFVLAQPIFVKKWDKRFGGTKNEGFLCLRRTTDGGYLLAGGSKSGIGGEKTQSSRGADDFWIVKIDSQGIKQWDKRFGGSAEDWVYITQQTIDKGYILGGTSNSGVGGDKSEPEWGGSDDYWIVKIDSLGNKEWDRRFGGTSSETLYMLQQTQDRGYILAGLSNSGINGDKTQDNWDQTYFHDDGWVVKIDSLGNKEWDKRFGGIDQDEIISMAQTDDRGYILGCYSASDSSGDKSQPSWGFSDYWIVKIDSSGNKEWDKRIGGTDGESLNALLKTSDNAYLLGGYSSSLISGDKSTDKGPYWLVKLDSSGNKLWDKGYNGGAGEFNTISQTSDNGFLFSCRTFGIGSDKSEENLGPAQAWIVKIDSSGNKQWDKTIFTTGDDGYSEAVEISNGCYVIAVGTSAGIGGYITEPNRDGIDSTGDYWIMKFCWEPVGINDVFNNSDVLVYPNPFTSDIAITLQKENLQEAKFTISNMLGQVVFKKKETNLANQYTKMLDLSYLPIGNYFVEVVADGKKVVKKVVKQ